MNMIPKSTTSPAIYVVPREDADKRHQFYQGALRDLQAAAKRGCARSQFELGVMYAQGIGVEVDTDDAFFWSNLAHRGGCADACNTLGELYQHGHGVPQDKKRAMDYYREGHRLESARSSNSLGKMYLDDHQYALAMECFLSAARKDFADAYNNLGYMYEHGLEAPQDFERAVDYYQKAADNGCVTAQDHVLRLKVEIERRQPVKSDSLENIHQLTKQKQLGMSGSNESNLDQKNLKLDSDQLNNPEQINNIPPSPLPDLSEETNQQVKKLAEKVAHGEEGWKEVLTQLTTLADNDCGMAQLMLGRLYFSGQGIEKSAERALGWLYKAATAKDVQIAGRACVLIVAVYRGECDLPADYDKAIDWCKKGMAKNFADAWVELGVMYEHGYGVQQDYDEAMRLYQEGANRGSHFGFNNMGVLYQFDRVKCGDKDTTFEAMESYQKAVLLGSTTSIRYLASLSARVYAEHIDKAKRHRKRADEYSRSAFLIGMIYLNGWGVKQKILLGFDYLASNLGGCRLIRADALFQTGKWCFQQQQPDLKNDILIISTKQWRALAIRYMNEASSPVAPRHTSDFGHKEALYTLGTWYELDPSEASQKQAFSYFERAATTDKNEGAINKLEAALLPIAEEHFANKNYEAAWNTYDQLFKANSVTAGFQLAVMMGADRSEKNVDQRLIDFRRDCLFKQNVRQDLLIDRLLRKIGDSHNQAAFMLAEREKDLSFAADSFEKLVRQGNPEASYRVGMIYIYPSDDVVRHVIRNRSTYVVASVKTKDDVIQLGVTKLKNAYKLGVAKAAYALGEYYWKKVNDSIIPSASDMKEAKYWFQAAVNAKVVGASQKLKEVTQKIDSVWFSKK